MRRPGPTPTLVGWAGDPKAPAVAWGDDPTLNPFKSGPADLRHALDLKTVEPVAVVPKAFELRRHKLGAWEVTFKNVGGAYRDVHLKQDGKEVGRPFGVQGRSVTLVPNGDGPPLVAYSLHDARNEMGAYAYLQAADGKPLAAWLPVATDYRDMAPSPDGRYVAVTTGTQRVSVYRTDGSRFPLLNIVRAKGEWVAWTAEGYYACSAGGDKLIGWALHNGPNELVTFHTAQRLAKHFHRPNVIKLALEKGSVKESLAALDAAPADVERILPPKARLEQLKKDGGKVRVKASATPGAKDKSVIAMRVLLDGRALPADNGVWAAGPGKVPEAEFEVEVPPGPHELKVLARSDDGEAVSEPLAVRGPKASGPQPTLYRVCVGVRTYDDKDLNLGVAAKDARDVFDGLAKHCVGPDNLFGAAKGELLLDKDASLPRVRKALEDARKAARPNDLVVVFFAGHGVKDDTGFYLLTKEADVNNLKGTSLSGGELQKLLRGSEGAVLLLLDACHSSSAAQSFRPATDDVARALTDEVVGVTVMSAAMSSEVAGGSAVNGHFTAGLVQGLKAGADGPFDKWKRQMLVNHLYDVAYSEVTRVTNGKQNPFLNIPWTMRPVAIRDVLEKALPAPPVPPTRP